MGFESRFPAMMRCRIGEWRRCQAQEEVPETSVRRRGGIKSVPGFDGRQRSGEARGGAVTLDDEEPDERCGHEVSRISFRSAPTNSMTSNRPS